MNSQVVDLDRFKLAHESGGVDGGETYETALAELKSGQKTSHWIWYVFPQGPIGGRSSTALKYQIQNLEEAKAEIGYWVTADIRGKGIATQATKLLTEYGFETIGFHRIEALVVESNKPSLKVLTKAGYIQEGVLRDKSCCGDGTRENMVMFAAIRSDWSA